MTGGPPDAGGGVRPPVALAFALIGFAALAICGLGVISLLLDADVIAVRGLGQLPGVAGMLLATAAFAGTLWRGLGSRHPSFWAAPVVALAAYLGELVGIVAGGLIAGTDPIAAIAAAGEVASSWRGLVVAVAALVSAWAGVALVRTRAGRPRWPWEGRDADE